MKSFAAAENRKKPNPEELFSDVYDEMPPTLRRQMQDMKHHVQQYREHYPLEHHDKMST